MQQQTDGSRPPPPVRRTVLAVALGLAGLALVSAALWMMLRGTTRGTLAPPREKNVDAGPADALQAEADLALDQATSTALPRRAPPKPVRKITDRELRLLQRAHHPLLMACYRRAAGRSRATATNRADVSVLLAPGGRVRRVRVAAGDEPGLQGCIRRIVSSWRFSRSLRAQQVSFSVVFR